MTHFFHYTADDYLKMAWKNGGGTTFEIARQTNTKNSQHFDWRVSMAVVEQDGAFSEFDGKHRLLAILAGDGLKLTINGNTNTLTMGEILSFDGLDKLYAQLLGGTVRDFNLIYNPTLYQGEMVWATTNKTIIAHPTTFLIAAQPTTLWLNNTQKQLTTYDCLQITTKSEVVIDTGYACLATIYQK